MSATILRFPISDLCECCQQRRATESAWFTEADGSEYEMSVCAECNEATACTDPNCATCAAFRVALGAQP